jgi:hypothetical protein
MIKQILGIFALTLGVSFTCIGLIKEIDAASMAGGVFLGLYVFLSVNK